MLRRILPPGLAVAIAFHAGAAAFADVPRPVELEYQPQEGVIGCPDAAAIRAGVIARLGYVPFREHADDRMRATIWQVGGALEARIELRDVGDHLKAERRLVSRDRDCAELASSVELAIAIAIDPVGLRPPHSGTEAGSPSSAENAKPSRSPDRTGQQVEKAAAAADRAAPALHPRVEAAVLGGFGSAPAPSLGLRAGADLQRGALSLGIEARADLPASASLRTGEATASLLIASVVPCAHLRQAAACLLVTGGALRVSGSGLLDARHATLPYLGLGARIEWAQPVSGRADLLFQLDAAAPVTQSKLTVSDTVVWTSAAVALTLGVGIAVRFP